MTWNATDFDNKTISNLTLLEMGQRYDLHPFDAEWQMPNDKARGGSKASAENFPLFSNDHLKPFER